MAYVLVSCKSLYTGIVYRVYNLKTQKQEQVNYDKLLYLLNSEGFTNLSFDNNRNVTGLKRYLEHTDKHSFVCVKKKDKLYILVNENGDVSEQVEEDLRKVPVKERSKYLNLVFGTKRVRCTDKSPKMTKLKRNNVKLCIDKVYIAYLEEDDEFVILVNSALCDKYNRILKAPRIAQKFYGVRSAEVEFDGVVDFNDFKVILMCGSNAYEVNEPVLQRHVYDYLVENLDEVSQWDETNKAYCLPFELSDEVKVHLYKIIIKYS